MVQYKMMTYLRKAAGVRKEGLEKLHCKGILNTVSLKLRGKRRNKIRNMEKAQGGLIKQVWLYVFVIYISRTINTVVGNSQDCSYH